MVDCCHPSFGPSIKICFLLGDHLVAEVNLDDLVRKELYAHYGDGDGDDGNDDDDRQV